MKFQQLTNAKDKDELSIAIMEMIGEIGFSDFCIKIIGSPDGTGMCSNEKLISICESKLLSYHMENSAEIVHLKERFDQVRSFPLKCKFIDDELIKINSFSDCFSDGVMLSVYMARLKRMSIFLMASNSPINLSHINTNYQLICLLAETCCYFASDVFPEEVINRYAKEIFEESKAMKGKPITLLATLVQGYTLKQAADKLCISLDTANKHAAKAKEIFGARTVAQAVYIAQKNLLI